MFFATAAGSSATLVGLLFVAIQLHLGVFSNPNNRWAALGQSTLTILATVFAMSLFFIMPGLALQVRGQVVVALVLFAFWRSARIWWPVVRLTEKGRRQRIAQSFWLLVLPVVAYTYLGLGGIGLASRDASSIINVGGATLTLFAISLRNAWRLVVSVERDESLAVANIPQSAAASITVARPGNQGET